MNTPSFNPIAPEILEAMCSKIEHKSQINPEDFWKYGVKRGLRNPDGTGVMAGLTKICSVEGYYIDDGERVPKDGVLKYRGINIREIIEGCEKDDRFGFEEVAYLLIFGSLPSHDQLKVFKQALGFCRELPPDFIEDVLMKNASVDVMNKLARCILVLYSFDEKADDISLDNVLRQSIQIMSQLPLLASYAYQVKRMKYYGKSMYFHPDKKELSTAETILRSIRADRKYSDEEAKLLDVCLMLQAEHGGGNNSTFTCRVLTSSGTDSYSAYSAAVGALKGPRHGGANLKVCTMLADMIEHIDDVSDDDQVRAYIEKLLRKEAGDRSGLVYGMGHAVYTLSDPRAQILRDKAERFAVGSAYEKEFNLAKSVERLTPEVFHRVTGNTKPMCANVDLYSGIVYHILGIPQDMFTPLFATARIAGWSAHRMEELLTGGRIIRPAYKSVALPKKYVPMEERINNFTLPGHYIPSEERLLTEVK